MASQRRITDHVGWWNISVQFGSVRTNRRIHCLDETFCLPSFIEMLYALLDALLCRSCRAVPTLVNHTFVLDPLFQKALFPGLLPHARASTFIRRRAGCCG